MPFIDTFSAAEMIINWNLKYLLFGNLWCLISAREDHMNQSDLTLVCFEDTVLVCSAHEDGIFSCINGPLCNEKQLVTKTKEAHRVDAQCDVKITNCSDTGNRNYTCSLTEPLRKHQNSSFVFKVTGCSSPNTDIKIRNKTSEILCYFIVPLSIFIMVLNYHCLKKQFTKESLTSPLLKEIQTEKADLV